MFGEPDDLYEPTGGPIYVEGADSGTSGTPLPLLIVALWMLGVLLSLLLPPVGIVLLLIALVVSFGAGVG